MRIDLHTHSAVSDGTDSPTKLVLNARMAELDVIGLTDHDTFDGVVEAQQAGARIGVTVVAGIEMSAEYEGHTVHLLGFGADTRNQKLNDELATIRAGRDGRLQAMADKLTELGFPLTVNDILAAAGAAPSLGRPHVADAMVAKGYVADRNEAFRRFIADDGPAYVGRYSPSVADAIRLLHDAGGVVILAHPWGREAADVLTAQAIERFAAEDGLDGIEVDHQDHTPEQRELLHELGGRLGLVRTGGSDYHGSGKINHELGCNTTRASALRELQRRIRERGGRV